MAVRICPSCGGKVASTRNTCSHCGHVMDSTKVCPECEESIDTYARECPSCGHIFDSIPMQKVTEAEVESAEDAKTTATPITESNKKVVVFHRLTTKEQFLRSVFYHLTEHNESPADILNATFGEVSEDEIEGFNAQGKANGHYSATIGYNKRETYYEDGKEKTRTVTDWHPHNGNIMNEACSILETDPLHREWIGSILRLFLRNDLSSILHEEEEKTVRCDEMYDACHRKLVSAVEAKVFNHLPGDTSKDFHVSVNISDFENFRCVVPIYTVYYEYNGKKYRASGIAIDGISPILEIPKESTTAISKEKLVQQKDAAVKAAEKPFWITVAMGILSFFALFMGGVGASMEPGKADHRRMLLMVIGFSGGALLLAGAFFIAITMDKKVKSIKHDYGNRIENIEHVKGLMFVKKLADYGFDTITSAEKIHFGLTGADLNKTDLAIDELLSAPPAPSSASTEKRGSGKYTLWLWITAGWTLLGYVINLIIAMCVGGYPGWMFQYIFAGYIAGFICMAIGVIAFAVLLILALKQRSCPRIHVILTSLLLAITLIVTFIPLAAEAKYDFKYTIYGSYYSNGGTGLSITALKDPRSECLVIPSDIHENKIYSVYFNLPETQSGSSQGMVAAPQAQSGSGKAQEIAHVTTLVFSNGIKEIHNLPTNLPDLKTIVIPASVTEIGWEFIADLENYYRTRGTRIEICCANDPRCGASTLMTYKIQIGTEYIDTEYGGRIEQAIYRYPDYFSTHRYDNCNHGHIK